MSKRTRVEVAYNFDANGPQGPELRISLDQHPRSRTAVGLICKQIDNYGHVETVHLHSVLLIRLCDIIVESIERVIKELCSIVEDILTQQEAAWERRMRRTTSLAA